MLFVFRGIRLFQVFLALVCLAMGIGAVLSILLVSEGVIIAIVPAVVLGFAFLWCFAAALRAPTSFVAIAEERTRIRFAGFVDTVVANADIAAARRVSWPLWGGIGIRSNFRGHVALTSAWGEAVELDLRNPVRIWIIPRLWKVKADRLTLSIRNGQKLVDHFGERPRESSPRPASARKMKRRGSRTS
ncbi:MAG: hypothetical protein WD557_12925 [Dehalococcoidia bacterium]